MSELVTIVMEPRAKTRSSGLRSLRLAGEVPCVYYGPEVKEAVMGKVPLAQITKLIRGTHWETMRLNLRLPDGSEEMCLVREVQRNPMTGKVRHVDFMRLIRGRKIVVRVPVEIAGNAQSPGIKEGGIVDHVRELEIETIPTNMPSAIVIDVSALNINDSVRVKDIAPEGYVILTDPEEVVASILPPRIEEEAAPVEGEQKEVEVVAKGKAAKGDE